MLLADLVLSRFSAVVQVQLIDEEMCSWLLGLGIGLQAKNFPWPCSPSPSFFVLALSYKTWPWFIVCNFRRWLDVNFQQQVMNYSEMVHMPRNDKCWQADISRMFIVLRILFRPVMIGLGLKPKFLALSPQSTGLLPCGLANIAHVFTACLLLSFSIQLQLVSNYRQLAFRCAMHINFVFLPTISIYLH